MSSRELSLRPTVLSLTDAQGRALHGHLWSPAEPGVLPAAAPIVLLHDSLGAVSLWRDFPAQLCGATGRMVLAYDRCGFGLSAVHPGVPGRDFIRDEASSSLVPVLDQLNIRQAILFGHSVGGGIAVSAAAQYPGRIIGVITESAQAFVEERTLDGIRAARDSFADPAQVLRLAKYHGNDPDKARWVLDAWIDTWLAPDFADWSLDDALRRIECPLLAMHGDQDEFGSSRHPVMIASLPSAFDGQGDMRMFSGCGHVPHRDRAGQVLDAVQAFLRSRFAGR